MRIAVPPYFELDSSGDPLLVLRTVGRRPPGDHDLQALFEVAAELIARDRPYVLVYVLGEAYRLDASQRRAYSRFIEENRADLARLNRGTALVIAHPIVRGIAKAVMWLAPPPTKVRIFADEASARAWAVTICEGLVDTRGAA